MTDNAAANLEASHSEPRLRPGELSMRSQRDGHVHTISLAGELDLANAHDVEAELTASKRPMPARSSLISPA